jgi:hypothetical protein
VLHCVTFAKRAGVEGGEKILEMFGFDGGHDSGWLGGMQAEMLSTQRFCHRFLTVQEFV